MTRPISHFASRRCWAATVFSFVLLVAACGGSQEAEVTPSGEQITPPDPAPEPIDWALAIHGGAGVIEPDSTDADQYYRSLARALDSGRGLLADGAAALEVVEQVVRILEDDPLFNAGRGAVFTNRGTHELDAAIMDGRTLSCGAVTGVRNVRNPIALARRVMERSPHVLLSGSGADEYAREVDVRRVQQQFFYTQRRYDQWRQVVRESSGRSTGPSGAGMGTVGAVALDRYGNLAAATSTGGLTNKRWGRVGDVPLIGAGTYANNETAALSCTGKGEQFIRHTVAHDISSRMRYANASLQEAAETVIHDVLDPGDGGVIGIDATGHIALVFNSPGMFRGVADSEGRLEIGIWQELRSAEPYLDRTAKEESDSPAQRPADSQ